MKILTRQLGRHSFIFSEYKTLYWEAKRTLVLSDIHLGKAAHFRKHGIAIPSEIMQKDLERLGEALDYFNPQRLIIVGDLIHAGNNSDTLLFDEWRAKHPFLEIDLVKGNHDRIKKEYLEKWKINLYQDQLQIEDILFVHEPVKTGGLFTISGHIHPGVSLKLQKHQVIRLACWAFNDEQLILPAFCSFSGMDTKYVRQGFQKIAVADGLIIEI
ncbi:metallophosphoesterase [Pseudopedobacter saltans DSM 12145]|uniref:Metallophosphoesterase n=1 Tax=Pseudopedobacter saltans (strain ATCC 51119 / DSM 12145 / JCM 21818 / CCUG 39354 / LMG 10337 / NBRC 100064 / NCIMB 13643) TaxID=762903 RepID=F0S589_PSESL|nr:ligase-associated DNA damage response endonuclease PdeM [Pseudopedobacter saltans]ADY52034.1 metallophosphoesterase [Pseudopedobacter saltans DSM 12145]